MKKSVLICAMLALASMQGMAQDTEKTLGKTDEKYSVLTNRFGANWFVTGQVGAQVFLGDHGGDGGFGGRISPSVNVGVGKWFTPTLGLRLMYSGINAKGYGKAGESFLGDFYEDDLYKKKVKYGNIHFDVMFDLCNAIGGYKEDRLYSAIPYVGIGLVTNFQKDVYGARHLHAGINAGLVNRFRVADGWDVNLEVSSLMMRDEFDQVRAGKKMDAMLGLSVGATYHFKPRGFGKAVVRTTGISQAEMDAVRNDLNDQIAKNQALEDELAREKSRKAAVKEEPKAQPVKMAPRLVFFDINKATISAREKVRVRYMAEQMKSYPDMKFTIMGYADNATGTAEYNQMLTQKRAENVYKMLVEEFGVNANQLTVEAKGGVANMFESNSLNRVVIVK